MKIKNKKMAYEQVLALPPYVHKQPRKQWIVLRWVIAAYAFFDLMRVGFKYTEIGMDKLGKKEPCLILMNHSCFIDMVMIGRIFRKRPYQIITTLDGFVGKGWLMRLVGCIPTRKFVSDPILIKDMVYATKTLKSSVVMYPEASYSFDGTATDLPASLGKCLKVLGVPVVMVRTYGAFARDPLYNNLQLRKVKVRAEVEYLLSPEEIKEKTPEELNGILKEQFSFDHFRWQQENQIKISEPFRADHLNRVLYKCPHCKTEGKMVGKGTCVTCHHCGKVYELTEYGFMKALDGETEIDHVPDWYRWEREEVRKEILEGTYVLDKAVDIVMMVNTSGVYHIGEGRLRHTNEGFHLSAFDGALDYHQAPTYSYSLYSDYNWYELGDVVGIGDHKKQFYCIPKDGEDIVAKTRLAAEEMFKIAKANEAEKRTR